nr:hypothetical protein [uncultured Sulfurimonas sp.]
MNSLLGLIKGLLHLAIYACMLVFIYSLFDSTVFEDKLTAFFIDYSLLIAAVIYIVLMLLPNTRREDIEIYTISDIGREYQVIGTVSATSSSSFNNVKLKLQKEADRLSADAIVGMVQSNESNVSGSVRTSLSGNVSGQTNTKTKYHMSGTAVKFLSYESNTNKQARAGKNSKTTGKFLNYDSNTGNGTIMLSDNSKMEFKINMWDDPELIPVAGMSDLNIYNENGRIRIMSKDYKLENLENSLN